MSQHAEDTSYWVEEKQHKSEIHFFKNYATDGYLGKEKLVYKKPLLHAIVVNKILLNKPQKQLLSFINAYLSRALTLSNSNPYFAPQAKIHN